VSGPNDGAADLALVKARIRHAATRQRRLAGAWVAGLAAGDGSLGWLEVKGRLRRADGLATAGTPPRLVRLHGWKRRLVLLLGGIIRRLGHFLTSRQTHYNESLLEAIRAAAQTVHELEIHLLRQQAHLSRLEALLEDWGPGADLQPQARTRA
jgi:hypothetical protein